MSIEECSDDLSYSYIDLEPVEGMYHRPDECYITRHEFTMDGKEHLMHARGYDIEIRRGDSYETVSYQDRHASLYALRRILSTKHVRDHREEKI